MNDPVSNLIRNEQTYETSDLMKCQIAKESIQQKKKIAKESGFSMVSALLVCDI